MSNFTNKKNVVTVGRGSAAIYMALKNEGLINKKVLVPANICYAAVLPIILSGNTPVFCDVDPFTGNITLDIVKKLPPVEAAVIPHMYGNTIEKINDITTYLHSIGAIVIEDCASALGARIDNRFAGDFGDYAVFSFGHSKTVELGNGGILATDKEVDGINALIKDLPPYTDQIGDNCETFSKLYRVLRNNPNKFWQRCVYDGLIKNAASMFLYDIDNELKKEIILKAETSEEIISKRRDAVKIYDSLIGYNDKLKRYRFNEGASPWRFNIYVDPIIRKQLIDCLLDKNIAVSDWYPAVTDIFNVDEVFEGTEYSQARILNFPLLIEKGQIKHIADTINSFFEG